LNRFQFTVIRLRQISIKTALSPWTPPDSSLLHYEEGDTVVDGPTACAKFKAKMLP
jgi:hypothetical protein